MAAQKTGAYKGLTEARRRANKKYNDRFVEIKVRVTPEKRSVIKDHAKNALLVIASLFAHYSQYIQIVPCDNLKPFFS